MYAASLVDAQSRAGMHLRAWWGDPAHWPAKESRGRGFRATFDRPEVDAAFGRLCAHASPHIVHVHHLTGLSLGIPAVARAHGARVVYTLHDAWLGCARGQLVNDAGDRCAGATIDRCAVCLAPALWPGVPSPLARALPLRRSPVRERSAAVARMLSQIDLVLSPSRHLPLRLGIEATYLPLPLIRPIPRAPEGPPGPVRFLFLGGLIPTKGAHLVLEAFARLPAGAASLAIVGPTLRYNGSLSYVDALRARVFNVPGASIHPAVAPATVPALLETADVLVFASTWDENSPLVLREAAAAGLRIVASDVPGTTEVLGEPGDGGIGARFEPGSVEALGRALAAEVRRGRSRTARAPAGALHLSGDLDAHAARLLDLYRGLLHVQDVTGVPR